MNMSIQLTVRQIVLLVSSVPTTSVLSFPPLTLPISTPASQLTLLLTLFSFPPHGLALSKVAPHQRFPFNNLS